MVTFLLKVFIKSLESHLGLLSSSDTRAIGTRLSHPGGQLPTLTVTHCCIHPGYSPTIWLGFPIYNVELLNIYFKASEGPGQLLLFTTSPTSTCTDSIHCSMCCHSLSPLSCCYTDLTNKDKWELYPE